MTRAESLRATLRALDAQRADALADHMRPDGARETTMTTDGQQVFRVFDDDGAERTVSVVEMAQRIADPDTGDAEELMEHGADVIAALLTERTTTAEQLAHADVLRSLDGVTR